jgi:glycosyltransferase involved in cell wall biosynthesis
VTSALRVVMTTYAYGPPWGGAERQADLLSRELVRQGHQVTYLCAGGPEEKRQEVEPPPDGMRVERLVRFVRPGRRKISVWRELWPELARWLFEHRSELDVVHCHGAFDATSLPVVRFGKKAGVPVVLKHASAREYEALFHECGVPGPVARRIHRAATAHVTNNRAVYRSLSDSSFTKGRIVQYVPNGVALPAAPTEERKAAARQEFDLANDVPVVASVSNFHPGKNQSELIEAWPEVRKTHPKARLLLAGDGAERAPCERLAAELGVSDSVRFLGSIPNVGQLLTAANVFVYPSRYPEGMPNALLEAMSHRLPCVVSDLEALLDVVGSDALVFGSNQRAHDRRMAPLIVRLLGDASVRLALGTRAFERVARLFGMPVIAGQYLQVYERSLAALRG